MGVRVTLMVRNSRICKLVRGAALHHQEQVVVRNGVALRKIFHLQWTASSIIGIMINTRGAGRSGNLSKDFRNKGRDKCCLWSVAIDGS